MKTCNKAVVVFAGWQMISIFSQGLYKCFIYLSVKFEIDDSFFVKHTMAVRNLQMLVICQVFPHQVIN